MPNVISILTDLVKSSDNITKLSPNQLNNFRHYYIKIKRNQCELFDKSSLSMFDIMYIQFYKSNDTFYKDNHSDSYEKWYQINIYNMFVQYISNKSNYEYLKSRSNYNQMDDFVKLLKFIDHYYGNYYSLDNYTVKEFIEEYDKYNQSPSNILYKIYEYDRFIIWKSFITKFSIDLNSYTDNNLFKLFQQYDAFVPFFNKFSVDDDWDEFVEKNSNLTSVYELSEFCAFLKWIKFLQKK